MHIIYDIKNKIASELAGFGFWQLNLSTAQNDFSNFRPGWRQFCWITCVNFNSIQSIIVWSLHIPQFTVCATKNLTVFVADSPRCLKWSSMAAVSLVRVSVAHAQIGPLKLAHFWSDIRWFPLLLFHYNPLHDWKRAGETVLNATVPTSPPGDHCQVESPARGYCAKNSAYVNKAG